jgi:hypothetical protein
VCKKYKNRRREKSKQLEITVMRMTFYGIFTQNTVNYRKRTPTVHRGFEIQFSIARERKNIEMREIFSLAKYSIHRTPHISTSLEIVYECGMYGKPIEEKKIKKIYRHEAKEK